MLFKVLFVFTIISLSVQVSAKERSELICEEMMTWTNQQSMPNRTWAAYSAFHADKLQTADQNEVRKMELAFETVKNSDMPPGLTEAECKKIFRSVVGRTASRSVDWLLKKNNEDEEMDGHVPEVPVDAILPTQTGGAVGAMLANGYNLPGTEESGQFCNPSDLVPEQNCLLSVNTLGIPVSFEQIMLYEEQKSIPLPAKYSVADCDCMDKKLKKENRSPASIINNAPDVSEKLKKVVVKAAGKKFLNDFASYLEDVQFYTTNKAWVLTKNKKNLDYYLCKDADDFQSVVDQLCTRNGTNAGKEARMAELMGAFGDKFNSTGKDFKTGMADLVEDINTYKDVRNVAEDKANVLTRSQYDPVRFGLSRSQPQVTLVNQLTTAILRDKDMKARLMAHIKDGKTPLYGVMDIMSGKSNPEDTKALMKILARKHPFLSGKINAMMEKIGSPEYNTGLNKLFHHALHLHPGLKNILMNPLMFEDVAKVVDKGNRGTSMLKLVEEDRDNITALFVDRCNDLKKNFAEAVCTKDEDLLSKVSPKDMMGVLRNQNDYKYDNAEAVDLLICNMNNNKVEPQSAFDGLNVAEINPYSASDYLDRKLHPTEQSNGMANLLNKSNKDPNFAKQVTSLAERFNHERVTMGAEKPSSHGVVGHAMKFVKNTDAIPESPRTSSSSTANSGNSNHRGPASESFSQSQNHSSSSNNSSHSGASMTKTNGQVMPTYATQPSYMPQTQISPVAPTFLSPSHEKLKQSFADNPEKEKYEKLISRIDSKDAEDLLDFEARVLKEKEKITNTILEEERKKTRSMEEKYEKIEKNHEVAGRNHTESGGSHTEFAPQQNFATDGFVQNDVSLPKESSGAASSNSMASGGNFRDVSGEASAVNTALKDVNSKADGKLIISATQSADGKEKGKEDPSLDLITYLKSNEPDSQTLKNLKEAGLIYSYETVDKTGKKIILQKVVKYSDLSPEARKLVDNKLAAITVKAMRRAVSIQALRLELMAAAHKKSQKI